MKPTKTDMSSSASLIAKNIKQHQREIENELEVEPDGDEPKTVKLVSKEKKSLSSSSNTGSSFSIDSILCGNIYLKNNSADLANIDESPSISKKKMTSMQSNIPRMMANSNKSSSSVSTSSTSSLDDDSSPKDSKSLFEMDTQLLRNQLYQHFESMTSVNQNNGTNIGFPNCYFLPENSFTSVNKKPTSPGLGLGAKNADFLSSSSFLNALKSFSCLTANLNSGMHHLGLARERLILKIF
jgi:hypothetical protein